MAHSYIFGNGVEFEVRDSICESVLDRLINELKIKKRNPSAIGIAEEWLEYWISMPPGCKDLKMEIREYETRKDIITALSFVISQLDPEAGEMRVAKQIKEVVDHQNGVK